MLNVSSGGHSVVTNAPRSPSWPQACPGKRRVTAWVTERARTQTSPIRNAELFLGTPEPQEAPHPSPAVPCIPSSAMKPSSCYNPHYPDTITQSSQLQDTQGAVSPAQLQFPTVWSDDTPDVSEYTVNFCLCGLTWTQGVQPASRAKLEATGLISEKQVHLFTLPFILKTSRVFKMLHRKLKPETSWSAEKTWCFHWKNRCIFVFILFFTATSSWQYILLSSRALLT